MRKKPGNKSVELHSNSQCDQRKANFNTSFCTKKQVVVTPFQYYVSTVKTTTKKKHLMTFKARKAMKLWYEKNKIPFLIFFESRMPLREDVAHGKHRASI